jgi:NADPH-dependent 2,4-dienoyl-CoA reductase/sulfur reductase-like enzyme
MDDAFVMQQYLDEREPRSAIIVGAGYIGMEMADALTYRGIDVTVVEFAESVLTTVDLEFGGKVREELQARGVRIATGIAVTGIVQSEHKLIVSGSNSFSAIGDMVLVAAGARPNSRLALPAGVETGLKGAIRVDRSMRTNVPHIFAAGDCVETWHRLLDRYTYMPLGTTAHKQGRVAGENAVGGNRKFQGSLGTQAVKIFDRVVAQTGLLHSEAPQPGSTRLRSSLRHGTIKLTIRAPRSYTFASPATVQVKSCWGFRCWGISARRYQSELMSLLRRYITACASMN